jgi:hypothetical protein
VDAAASCARWDRRAGDEPVSDQQHADERCCCVRRSRVVLTPRCWRQVCGVASAQPGLDKTISASDGGKQARSPGRARNKPLKPLRAGMPGDSGVLVVARVLLTTTKRTRGCGCSGHPAFPTPFLGGERFINASGALRCEIAESYLDSTSLRAKRPRTPSFRGDAKHRTRNLEIPGLVLRTIPERRLWFTSCLKNYDPSCPDLIRASIHLRKKVLSKKMDHRVKPGDDDLNWCDRFETSCWLAL